MTENRSKYCHSCSMPLKKDDRENKNGLDPRYCSFCFQDGDFLVKGVSAKEFRDTVYELLRNQGWSKPMAWLGTRSIPNLPRWKQDDPDQVFY